MASGRKLHLTFEAAANLYLKKLQEIDGKDYVNNEQHTSKPEHIDNICTKNS